MNWTHTIDILGQLAYGNMSNQNITSAQAKKRVKKNGSTARYAD